MTDHNLNRLFLDSHGVVWESFDCPPNDGQVEAFGPTGFARETPWHWSTLPGKFAVEKGSDGWDHVVWGDPND